jgi:L-lactate dehydrogenase complex protein LldG
MKAREKILQAIRKAGAPERIRPAIGIPMTQTGAALPDRFMELLRQVGGGCRMLENRQQYTEFLRQDFPGARQIDFCTEEANAGSPPRDFPSLVHQPPDLVVLEASVGVAENGAVWLSDRELPRRVLPFIAEHVLVLLRLDRLVPDLHAAYARIGAADYGYGLFLSGPSKTADIEQSLVIGAQGAKSLQVYLYP